MLGKGLHSQISPFGPYNGGGSLVAEVDFSTSVDAAAAVQGPQATPP